MGPCRCRSCELAVLAHRLPTLATVGAARCSQLHLASFARKVFASPAKMRPNRRRGRSAAAEKAMSRAYVSANLCEGGELYGNGPILLLVGLERMHFANSITAPEKCFAPRCR